ncbi:hypothetical protein YC2023_005188 [Brassica napus]|nr:unnamed protein product [Brassica napus]
MILREKQGGRSLMFYLRHVECGGPSHQETDQATLSNSLSTLVLRRFFNIPSPAASFYATLQHLCMNLPFFVLMVSCHFDTELSNSWSILSKAKNSVCFLPDRSVVASDLVFPGKPR